MSKIGTERDPNLYYIEDPKQSIHIYSAHWTIVIEKKILVGSSNFSTLY